MVVTCFHAAPVPSAGPWPPPKEKSPAPATRWSPSGFPAGNRRPLAPAPLPTRAEKDPRIVSMLGIMAQTNYNPRRCPQQLASPHSRFQGTLGGQLMKLYPRPSAGTAKTSTSRLSFAARQNRRSRLLPTPSSIASRSTTWMAPRTARSAFASMPISSAELARYAKE